MKIEIFALCEAAEDQQGRLSLLGTYERIGVPHLPFQLTEATVALRLRISAVDGRIHFVALHCIGPDGRRAMDSVTSPLHIDSFSHAGSAACNVIIRLPVVTIEEHGEHSFDFYLDDELRARLPLLVAKPAPWKTVQPAH